MRRFYWAWFIGAVVATAGCAYGPVPVTPVPNNPGPVNPGPVDPPHPAPIGAGSITEAQYAEVFDGELESDLIARVGKPYDDKTAANLRVMTYTFAGDRDHVAWFFGTGGKIVKKDRK